MICRLLFEEACVQIVGCKCFDDVERKETERNLNECVVKEKTWVAGSTRCPWALFKKGSMGGLSLNVAKQD